jgi:hypothetical protein
MSTPSSVARTVATLVVPPAAPASLAWKVVVLFDTGGSRVLSEGRKAYDADHDILVEPVRGASHDARTVSIPLSCDFVMSVGVCQQVRVDGFGLFISRRGNAHGFSWEWFDRAGRTIFEKRQGCSRVAVNVRRSGGYEELESMEFVDDVALRYLDHLAKPPGTHTHEVIVRKGSIFRLAP